MMSMLKLENHDEVTKSLEEALDKVKKMSDEELLKLLYEANPNFEKEQKFMKRRKKKLKVKVQNINEATLNRRKPLSPPTRRIENKKKDFYPMMEQSLEEWNKGI